MMTPVEWLLKCNLYARMYPASVKQFKEAVPLLNGCTEEWFQIAGELLSTGMLPHQVRSIFYLENRQIYR